MVSALIYVDYVIGCVRCSATEGGRERVNIRDGWPDGQRCNWGNATRLDAKSYLSTLLVNILLMLCIRNVTDIELFAEKILVLRDF